MRLFLGCDRHDMTFRVVEQARLGCGQYYATTRHDTTPLRTRLVPCCPPHLWPRVHWKRAVNRRESAGTGLATFDPLGATKRISGGLSGTCRHSLSSVFDFVCHRPAARPQKPRVRDETDMEKAGQVFIRKTLESSSRECLVASANTVCPISGL